MFNLVCFKKEFSFLWLFFKIFYFHIELIIYIFLKYQIRPLLKEAFIGYIFNVKWCFKVIINFWPEIYIHLVVTKILYLSSSIYVKISK